MLEQMVTLDISVSNLTGAGAAELAASPNVASLERLELQGNFVDDTGVIALAHSPFLGRLTYLGLGGNGAITEKGIRSLASSPFLTRLTCLNLAYLDFSAKTGAVLAESECLLHLRKLHGFQSHSAGILARLAERRRERGLP